MAFQLLGPWGLGTTVTTVTMLIVSFTFALRHQLMRLTPLSWEGFTEGGYEFAVCGPKLIKFGTVVWL